VQLYVVKLIVINLTLIAKVDNKTPAVKSIVRKIQLKFEIIKAAQKMINDERIQILRGFKRMFKNS